MYYNTYLGDIGKKLVCPKIDDIILHGPTDHEIKYVSRTVTIPESTIPPTIILRYNLYKILRIFWTRANPMEIFQVDVRLIV